MNSVSSVDQSCDKPDDAHIVTQWNLARRLWKNRLKYLSSRPAGTGPNLAERLALKIIGDLEKRGVTEQDIERLLAQTATGDVGSIVPGSLWRHYKGAVYRVLGLCRIEAGNVPAVRYTANTTASPVEWVRPASEWLEPVDGHGPRFMQIK